MPEDALALAEIMEVLCPMADQSQSPASQIAYATMLYAIMDAACGVRMEEEFELVA